MDQMRHERLCEESLRFAERRAVAGSIHRQKGHQSHLPVFVRGNKQNQLFAGGGQAGAATNDPANGSYTPSNLFGQPQTSLLSARIGTRWSGIEVSLFANNLLDSHTLLSQGGTPVVAPGEATVLQQTTFRPRTIGITGTYRY
jgi:hypothetical protein